MSHTYLGLEAAYQHIAKADLEATRLSIVGSLNGDGEIPASCHNRGGHDDGAANDSGLLRGCRWLAT